MTMKDEELQNKIDKEGSFVEGIDGYAYKKVFDVLNQEPSFQLPINFADKVVQKIQAKRESSTDFLWFGVGISLFSIATIFTILLTNFKISFGALKFVSGYPGLFIFGAGFVLLLHWLDKKLVRPKASF